MSCRSFQGGCRARTSRHWRPSCSKQWQQAFPCGHGKGFAVSKVTSNSVPVKGKQRQIETLEGAILGQTTVSASLRGISHSLAAWFSSLLLQARQTAMHTGRKRVGGCGFSQACFQRLGTALPQTWRPRADGSASTGMAQTSEITPKVARPV